MGRNDRKIFDLGEEPARNVTGNAISLKETVGIEMEGLGHGEVPGLGPWLGHCGVTKQPAKRMSIHDSLPVATHRKAGRALLRCQNIRAG
ncbi:hypothetical protein GCM10008941_38730 [Rhizomicrobium palustre]